MNRYSLLFAAVMLATFAVPSPKGGDTGAANKDKGSKFATVPSVRRDLQDAESFLCEFVRKAGHNKQTDPCSTDENTQSGKIQADTSGITVLFVTIAHPLETHLAADFDFEVDALIDGLQDSRYLYDSSWIPWDAHGTRENYDDDQKELQAKENEDTMPGILLFRSATAGADAYSSGAVVFLITEKPTGGIAIKQAENAANIVDASVDGVNRVALHWGSTIRILGPSFSGSYPSLVPMVRMLAERAGLAEPSRVRDFRIRSGSATVGEFASAAALAMAETGSSVDLGSAQHDVGDWKEIAFSTLGEMGIPHRQVLDLSEDESAFGASSDITTSANEWVSKRRAPNRDSWQLKFPRDISSLRSSYETQGILDTYAPQEPWKRALTVKNEETGGGDTVQPFGGAKTDATKESVLFGISEFLRSHGIRAVLISATNEEDRYFLTQFIHAHNGGTRVVVFGATRLFTRGSTAQFRGDLIVDDFPLLPRLDDWTSDAGKDKPLDARVFPGQGAQGVYFAALDLMAKPDPFAGKFPWVPEFSPPLWESDVKLSPPMYVAALGSNATWPVGMEPGDPWDGFHPANELSNLQRPSAASWHIRMPFALFAPDNTPPMPANRPAVHAGSCWIALFVALIFGLALYCCCFWCADSLRRPLFAGFEPLPNWRYWVCRVIIPGFSVSGAFSVMALVVHMGNAASGEAQFWWFGAILLTVLAPWAIAAFAWNKAGKCEITPPPQCGIVLVAACVVASLLALPPVIWRPAGTSSILNAYREMHWESGLSLIPTVLLLLLALVVWCYQAGQGLAIFELAPPLPAVESERIDKDRSSDMLRLSYPFPWSREARSLWGAWFAVVVVLLVVPFTYQDYWKVTTLEPHPVTCFLLLFAGLIGSLALFDLLQFLWMWMRLKEMLRALEYQPFKRSFVPLEDFNWGTLWSFSGVSRRDRQKIMAAQGGSVRKLVDQYSIGSLRPAADWLAAAFSTYTKSLHDITAWKWANDRRQFQEKMQVAGTEIAGMLANPEFAALLDRKEAAPQPAQQIVNCNCHEKDKPFAAEWEEVASLAPARREAERFLCLLYAGFIHPVMARLHSLLVSVAAIFSLAALAVAIYPFAPVTPLATAGLVLMAMIAIVFFTVLRGINTDPIMGRIVNRDDRKLQWSFYAKFAESLALPLLTLASTLLPGGTSRVLELTKVLFSQGQ